ncbi:epoxide hydrolase [Leifsonia shinshuensis]|uniref:epoxide hydrolase family protein n=1 Tax=Leifsonia shinshuensis TaxID=150026 RepID=UPI00285C4617|nr:epoxide hydrolase [Leifsonia shinshuensis]MDR6971239.1 pimeloyl-ACP methyl ester carboxylesterase [Leifsonia shinshuensis]
MEFRIDVPQPVLDDLRHRLEVAILPEQTPGPDWSNGIPPHVLAGLVDRWRDGYDWRAFERRLDRYDQWMLDLDGCAVHVVRAPARAPSGALPIVLTHGWPYSFASMLDLADLLSEERDVVIPSLPGYGYSAPLPEPYSSFGTARRWHALMTRELGYDRYLTYGEDVGAGVSDWLAASSPESVAGIVASHASFSGRSRPGVELTDEERTFLASVASPAESGYAHEQGTRPDTLAAALIDSPSGLLAWIVEKVAAWSDGDALERFDVDDVLTNVTLYWVTRSIGTSFRPYRESPDDDELHPVITVPASILVQRHEAAYPRSLAEKSYADIRSFNRLERGGHFTAWEAPDAIAAAVRDLEARL